MGIETAALMAYASAATAGVSIYNALSKPDAPAAAAVPAPEKPPQATKTPDRKAVGSANAAMAAGPMAGNASTFLTGSGGVDPGALNLGKNTLLGQ
jgi:hypothetical protein